MTAARTGKARGREGAARAQGATWTPRRARGQTALMWAAAEGNVEVVEVLIEAGADFKARLSSGSRRCLFAVREGHGDVVRALLKAGVGRERTGPGAKAAPACGGGRALPPGDERAAPGGGNAHLRARRAFLLDAGADPNASAPGFTAAARHSLPVRKPGGGDNDPAPDGSGKMTSLEFVKKLVAKGANLERAHDAARELRHRRSLNTLGATPFLLAARTADAELMRVLAKLGADPLHPERRRRTPLMVAAGLGTRSPGEDAGTESEVLEAVQVALELGDDINAVDNNGETAMHGAAYKNLPKVVQFLAAKGAKIDVWNRQNKHGWTPLTIAEGYRFGNFKPSPDTEASIRDVMIAGGVTPPKVINAKTQQIY